MLSVLPRRIIWSPLSWTDPTRRLPVSEPSALRLSSNGHNPSWRVRSAPPARVLAHAPADLRYIEENFVFSTTRKLLGLGPAMDQMLGDAQEDVVAKFDVLDIKEAVSSAQLASFNLLMKLGVIGLGVYLMVGLLALPRATRRANARLVLLLLMSEAERS